MRTSEERQLLWLRAIEAIDRLDEPRGLGAGAVLAVLSTGPKPEREFEGT